MLTNNEFNSLKNMKKEILKCKQIIIPKPGKKLILDVISVNKKEDFNISLYRNRINFEKITYQNLHKRTSTPLIRIDLAGPPHFNPDGEKVLPPHIHIYKEGYGDKWAEPLNNIFTNTNDLVQLLYDFLKYCNIINIPQNILFIPVLTNL
ncbi:DUF6978 family protein [Clostridium ganghwense]|uniref:Lj965 prophage protein n=1 Tax=Clostridium ganghwense TaxID=312089 RepID=A0ABT4CU14_9CLOT|nr:hypothetical protein [Clostridium ganghwense]MCY6372408.1 hypothetical protein [Clostridium ganghwense]